MFPRLIIVLALCLTVCLAKMPADLAYADCAKHHCKKGTVCIETMSGARCVWRKPCGCSYSYRPVCCKTPYGYKTKRNECLCRCVRGALVSSYEPCSPPSGCSCKKVYSPTCCKVKEGIYTAGNKCSCRCQKGIVVKSGCVIPSLD